MPLPPEPQKPEFQLPRQWPFWVLVGALFIAVVVTVVLLVNTMRGIFGPSAAQETFVAQSQGEGEEQVLDPDAYSDVELEMQHRNGPESQPWDGKSRLYILLLGVDDRTATTNDGPPRTDTMILVSIDPETKTAGMLSLPRDLWVNVPGHGEYKINQAYFLGEAEGMAGGGAGLALATVEDFFDLEIPYYAQINFDVFISLIDEIGGVKINVPDDIQVNLGHGHVVNLKPGVQTLPGDIALAYARMRDTAGGDFDRAARQQQILHGIFNRLTNFDLLPDLIAKTPFLYRQFSSGFTTNLTVYQLARLAKLAYELPEENIYHAVITQDYVTPMLAYNGAYILVPIPEKMAELREQFLNAQLTSVLAETPTPTVAPVAVVEATHTPSPAAPTSVVYTPTPADIIATAPGVAILNGTTTAGLAADTQAYLQSFGVSIVRIGNADKIYYDTTIIDYTGNPAAIAQIKQAMNFPDIKIYNSYDPDSEVDLAVILGEDWAAENPLP